MKIYLVGGAIRDKLLGIKSQDKDWVVVGATKEQMLSLSYQQVGKDFPVFLHPKTKEEYALARTERKTSHGYTGFATNTKLVTLEEDLLRRDLTINAMAQDEQGNIIDPYNGQKDLKLKLLSAVSDSFSEDPVRILRIARFAAQLGEFGFKVDSKTNQLLKQMVLSGELDSLVPERIWQETLKALKTKHPEKFFDVLRGCNALEKILPELNKLFGIPQNKKYHPEVDTGIHTMLVLQQACKLTEKAKVRFAALLHDLGKGETPKNILPNHNGHEQRSENLVKNVCQRLKVPNDFKKLAILVAKYHGDFHKVADELTATEIIVILEALNAFRDPELFRDFLLACEADQKGRPGFENLQFPQVDFFEQAYTSAKEVTAKKFIAQGITGIKIQENMHKERIYQVNLLIENYRK